jgi:hypothetical protein
VYHNNKTEPDIDSYSTEALPSISLITDFVKENCWVICEPVCNRRLLLQGSQACFRLQENASSHLAMGRPIFRYPLSL